MAKTARQLAIDLAFAGKDDKPKRRKSGFAPKICDISSAKGIIRKFAELKRDVDSATIGALDSSRSVFGGGGGARRKKRKASAPMFKKSAKKSSKKRAKKA